MTFSFRPGFWRTLAGSTLLLALVGPASAQMQLPGPDDAPAAPAAAPKPAKPKPKPAPSPRLPNEDTLLNRALLHNGRAGEMRFIRDGKDLKLSKLVFAGEKISRPAERCVVEAPAPIALEPEGKPRGVLGFKAAAPDCPFAFDVLDGAVLVSPRPACEFKAADCRVEPAGLWGQPASEIGANRAKEIERARNPAEQAMRDSFRAWVEAVRKDRDLVRRVSREQAGFSSRRAEICSTYAREAEHGYCGLLLTQARSLALAARTPPPEEPPEPAPATRRRTAR